MKVKGESAGVDTEYQNASISNRPREPMKNRLNKLKKVK
jgi:hypothetical protein